MIIGGARTPMTDYVGALKDISALDLGAIAARGAFERTGVKPEWVDHVVVGNVLQTSADAIYGARHVGLKAGVPIEVPALTVNRLCGSGIQAAVSGAQLIQLGEAGMVLTGGIESMSQAPHVIRGLRGGLKLGQGKLEDALWEALVDTHCGCSMAITAENCACRYGISRADQDEYALRSQQLADRAWTDGRLAEEVVPVEIKTRKSVEMVFRDDHMRPETTMDVLAKLPAAFKKDGCVTAGNASGIVDGGAALILASRETADRHGSRSRHARRAEACRHDARRSRSHRGQRSVCCPVPGRREGAGARSRPGQCERWRNRPRPSARRHRHAPHPDAPARAAPPRPDARPGDRLYRRRTGNRGDCRGGVVQSRNLEL
jgi:acetyl-CoA acetyltransferase family protein